MTIKEKIHIQIVQFIETIFCPLQIKAESQLKRHLNK